MELVKLTGSLKKRGKLRAEHSPIELSGLDGQEARATERHSAPSSGDNGGRPPPGVVGCAEQTPDQCLGNFDVGSSNNSLKLDANNTIINDNVESDTYINCLELCPEPLLSINININSETVNALLDTGSTSNMIRKSTADRLCLAVIMESSTMMGLGSESIKTLGVVKCAFSFYNIEVPVTHFHVVYDHVIKTPVLLGKNFFF